MINHHLLGSLVILSTVPVVLLRIIREFKRLSLKVTRVIFMRRLKVVGSGWKVMLRQCDDPWWSRHTNEVRILGQDAVLQHDLTGGALGA